MTEQTARTTGDTTQREALQEALQEALSANETHQNAYLGFKNEISRAIGSGRLPNDQDTIEWLRSIDAQLERIEAERQVLRFDAGYPFTSIPPDAGDTRPDPGLRWEILASLYGTAFADNDRLLWDRGEA